MQVYPVEQQLKSPWSSFHPGYMYIVWLKKCALPAPCICSISQAPWLQEANCQQYSLADVCQHLSPLLGWDYSCYWTCSRCVAQNV